MLTNSESSKSHRIYFDVGDRVECMFYGKGSVTRHVPALESGDGTEKICVHFDEGADISYERNGLLIAGHENEEWDLRPIDSRPPMDAKDWWLVGFMAGVCATAGAWGLLG